MGLDECELKYSNKSLDVDIYFLACPVKKVFLDKL